MEKKEKKATDGREERGKGGENEHGKEKREVEMEVYESERRDRGIRHIVESER